MKWFMSNEFCNQYAYYYFSNDDIDGTDLIHQE